MCRRLGETGSCTSAGLAVALHGRPQFSLRVFVRQLLGLDFASDSVTAGLVSCVCVDIKTKITKRWRPHQTRICLRYLCNCTCVHVVFCICVDVRRSYQDMYVLRSLLIFLYLFLYRYV